MPENTVAKRRASALKRYERSLKGKKQPIRPGAAKRWQTKNPEKRRAHIAVAHAIRSGLLVRPSMCERCQEPNRVQAHHDDYSKTLDVRWFCHPCHQAFHREQRERG